MDLAVSDPSSYIFEPDDIPLSLPYSRDTAPWQGNVSCAPCDLPLWMMWHARTVHCEDMRSHRSRNKWHCRCFLSTFVSRVSTVQNLRRDVINEELYTKNWRALNYYCSCRGVVNAVKLPLASLIRRSKRHINNLHIPRLLSNRTLSQM